MLRSSPFSDGVNCTFQFYFLSFWINLCHVYRPQRMKHTRETGKKKYYKQQNNEEEFINLCLPSKRTWRLIRHSSAQIVWLVLINQKNVRSLQTCVICFWHYHKSSANELMKLNHFLWIERERERENPFFSVLRPNQFNWVRVIFHKFL